MEFDLKQTMKNLFSRRQQKARWIFVVASLVLFVFAIMGYHYGAFYVYFALGLICLCQVFYPTLIAWAFISLLFLVGASLYIIEVVKDVVKIAIGERPNIFVDLDDSLIFCVLISLILLVAFTLIKVRPAHLNIK